MSFHSNRRRMMAGTILAGIASFSLAAVPAQAQSNENASAEEDDTIVVTGSRIRRADLDTIYPTTSVDSEDLEKNAFTNMADALNQIPAFGAGTSTNGDAGQVGANFADFLDLGSQRTLTLVNGRRFVSQNNGGTGQQVDFSILPMALVERIDTIGVGGAPTYGSDAIAGTINVVLRDDYEGMDVTTRYGISDEGDLEEYNLTFLMGANSEDGRFNVTFSGEYAKQDGLFEFDRDNWSSAEGYRSEVPPGTPGFTDYDVDGDGTLDGVQRTFTDVNIQLFSNGGAVSSSGFFAPSLGLGAIGGNYYQFDTNGELIPWIAGQAIPGTNAFRAQGGTPNNFFDERAQLRSPLERIIFGSTMRYDVTPNITFRSNAQFANSKAADLADQAGFQTFAFTDSSLPLQFSTDNPFLSSQARNLLEGNGVTDFTLHRTLDDILGRGEDLTETNLWRIAGSLEGDFNLGERNFYWELSAVAGQTTNHQTTRGVYDGRYLNALDAVIFEQADYDAVVAAGGDPLTVGNVGDIVCRSLIQREQGLITGVTGMGVTAATIPEVDGCVPLNLFGEGVSSQAAQDWVTYRSALNNNINQAIWAANVGGELFELPAGWTQFSIGFETRRESASFLAGGADAAPLGRAAAAYDTGGGYTTQEFMAEVLVPLVSPDMDIPFVHSAEFEGAVRVIDNTAAGEFTAWTMGGQFSPFDGLTFRGNATESFRAPSLDELYAPITASFEFADDPCDARYINDDLAGQDGVRAQNCAAAGVPIDANNDGVYDFTSNAPDATVLGRSGGNPNLRNEVAESYTVGFAYQPHFFEGFTFQADYISIELADAIGTLSLEQLMETCYDAQPADFPNASCNTFERDGSHRVVDFLSGQTNSDSYSTEFLNLKADYNFDVVDAVRLLGREASGDWGLFSIDTQVFHVITRDEVVAGVTQSPTIGSFLDPEWSGLVDLTWVRGGTRVFWRTLWQGETLFSPSGNNYYENPNGQLMATHDAYFTHNMSIAQDLSYWLPNYDNPLIAQFTITNVFEPETDLVDQAFGRWDFTDAFGRRFAFSLRASF